MRISFSLLFILFLFTACGPGKGRIRIEGKLKHLDKAECYLYAEGGDFSKPDTIIISGGKFKLEKELPEACLLTILYPNATTTTFVGEPGTTIKIDGDAGRLDEVDISGSELNERLTKFRQQQAKKTKSDQLMAATQYIRDHAKSLDALALYYKYYVDNDATDANVALELLNLLRKGLPQSKALITLDAALRPLKTYAAGRTFPDFSVQTLAGKTLTRASLSGKPTLLFWCSLWSSESSTALSEAQRLQTTYTNRLNVVAISLDPDAENARKYAESLGYTGPFVCDGKVFQTPLARLLGVRGVPSGFIINTDGRIVARDLPVSQWDSQVQSVVH